VYGAAKGAIEAMTRMLAREFGQRNITINALAPGATDTDLFNDLNNPESRQLFVSMTVLGRIGESMDIADAVAFLASDDSRFVTGQTLRVDGGLA
jgi:3-oxoacyl-[acyl-carrier protein] reductase